MHTFLILEYATIYESVNGLVLYRLCCFMCIYICVVGNYKGLITFDTERGAPKSRPPERVNPQGPPPLREIIRVVMVQCHTTGGRGRGGDGGGRERE